MASFVAAYLAVWLGTLWYVARLGMHERRLSRAIERMQLQIDARDPE